MRYTANSLSNNIESILDKFIKEGQHSHELAMKVMLELAEDRIKAQKIQAIKEGLDA